MSVHVSDQIIKSEWTDYNNHLNMAYYVLIFDVAWEVMLKKAEITWQTPVKFANKLQIRCEIESWGNTSFTAHFEGKVEDAPSFTASVIYVCVDHENYRPIPVPQELHDHLATAQNS